MSNYTENRAGPGKINYISLTSGTRLRYLKTGTGRALVLMHTLRTQLDYFQKIIPKLTAGSRMLTLADTGHFASLEDPDEVARILIDATR